MQTLVICLEFILSSRSKMKDNTVPIQHTERRKKKGRAESVVSQA